MKAISIFLALTLLSACQTPMLTFPGKKLAGIEATTDSFAFAERFPLLKLEVNPPAPYSVILRCTVIDGKLYVDAASSRQWAKYLDSDKRVRVKLGDALYRAVAKLVTATEITERFQKGRAIYELLPANP